MVQFFKVKNGVQSQLNTGQKVRFLNGLLKERAQNPSLDSSIGSASAWFESNARQTNKITLGKFVFVSVIL